MACVCYFAVRTCRNNIKDVRNAFWYVDNSTQAVIYKCKKGFYFDSEDREDDVTYYETYDDTYFREYYEDDDDYEPYSYYDYYHDKDRYAKVDCECEDMAEPTDCIRTSHLFMSSSHLRVCKVQRGNLPVKARTRGGGRRGGRTFFFIKTDISIRNINCLPMTTAPHIWGLDILNLLCNVCLNLYLLYKDIVFPYIRIIVSPI